MHESQVEVLGFDFLKDLHEIDSYFQDAFQACRNLVNRDRGPWNEYMLQDEMLFKNSKLCIPIYLMRENLIQEKHNGGMAGHFGIDKTLGQLSHFYFWPKMRLDVEKFVSRCQLCQHAKGRSQNTILCTPLPMSSRP